MSHNKPFFLSWVLFMGTMDRWKALPGRLKRLVHLRVAMRVGCPS